MNRLDLKQNFRSAPYYWIGLTYVIKESGWQWTSGEPVTYTNWAPYEPIDTDEDDEATYVFMGHSLNGKWYNVGPKSAAWQFPKMAIIEKDTLEAKTPVKRK